jgi:hypothetical protein
MRETVSHVAPNENSTRSSIGCVGAAGPITSFATALEFVDDGRRIDGDGQID